MARLEAARQYFAFYSPCQQLISLFFRIPVACPANTGACGNSLHVATGPIASSLSGGYPLYFPEDAFCATPYYHRSLLFVYSRWCFRASLFRLPRGVKRGPPPAKRRHSRPPLRKACPWRRRPLIPRTIPSFFLALATSPIGVFASALRGRSASTVKAIPPFRWNRERSLKNPRGRPGCTTPKTQPRARRWPSTFPGRPARTPRTTP